MPAVRNQSETAAIVLISNTIANLWTTPGISGISDELLKDRPNLLNVFLEKLYNCAEQVFFLGETNPALQASIKQILPDAEFISGQSEISVIRKIYSHSGAIKNVLVFSGILPLFDTTVYDTLSEIHTKYQADCSFTENAMPGITPHIFSRFFTETLDALQISDDTLEGVSLQAFVEKNLNKFHVEIHFEFPDLRMLRADFSCNSARSMFDTISLSRSVGTQGVYALLEPAFAQNPGLLYSLPSYIELEPYSGCSYQCMFCPRQAAPIEACEFTESNFVALKEFISQGFGDTTVCLGGWGEPLEYSLTSKFIRELSHEQNVKQVVLETNGFQLDKLISECSGIQLSKLKVIVNLNSLENYQGLHGVKQTQLETVKQNIRLLKDSYQKENVRPADNLYVQVLKINENYNEIDQLYDFCENSVVTFLLQKYNSYAGMLPERRVSDMTPLERTFCWHLRRDMFISADGSVQFCKQVRNPTANRGNLSAKTLAEIWSDQKKDFHENYSNKLSTKMPCGSCDEYFTFNA